MTLQEAINLISFWVNQGPDRSVKLSSGKSPCGGTRFEVGAYEKNHLKYMNQNISPEDAITYIARVIATAQNLEAI